MTDVLTALGNRWDSRVATLLGASREVTIVRRCADLPDLVATAAAGVGTVALVSSDLRGLDLTAVMQLRSAGVQVVGIVAGGDEESERRLLQLGIARVVPGNAELAEFEAALTAQAVDAAFDAFERQLDAFADNGRLTEPSGTRGPGSSREDALDGLTDSVQDGPQDGPGGPFDSGADRIHIPVFSRR